MGRNRKMKYPMIKLANEKPVCRFCGGERTHRNNCKFIVRVAVMGSDKFQNLSHIERRNVMDEINELSVKYQV